MASFANDRQAAARQRYPLTSDSGSAPAGYSHPRPHTAVGDGAGGGGGGGSGGDGVLPSESISSLASGLDAGVPRRSIDLPSGAGASLTSPSWATSHTDAHLGASDPDSPSRTRRRPKTTGTAHTTGNFGKSSSSIFDGSKILSMSGAYSRKPPVSHHRRAKSPFFTLASRSFDTNVDPYNSPLLLKPAESVGKQVLTGTRTAERAPIGSGTRDEANKMHPPFAPGLSGSIEVGPGSYRAPAAVGPQLSSEKASPAEFSFGTAIRESLDSLYSKRSPGPAYAPKLGVRSQDMNTKTVFIGRSQRKPLNDASETPGAIYEVDGRFALANKSAPRVGFTRGKRPPNKAGDNSPGAVYDIDKRFAGHQRRAPVFGFGKAKRF